VAPLDTVALLRIPHSGDEIRAGASVTVVELKPEPYISVPPLLIVRLVAADGVPISSSMPPEKPSRC